MPFEQPQSEVKIEQKEKPSSFFERIGRPELKEHLTPQTPWAYFTMELYGSGIRGGGGLGILAADTLEVKKKAQIPSVFITPFYTKERHQVFKGFEQRINLVSVKPERRGFKPAGWSVTVREIVDGKPDSTELQVYQKQEGSATLLTVTEKNFGAL